MKIKTTENYSSFESVLCCPDCGGEYLHQEEVDAVWRPEDMDGTEYNSSHDGYSVKKIRSEKITGRRDALKIHFTCEFCANEVKTLEIYQHKGFTMMRWFK